MSQPESSATHQSPEPPAAPASEASVDSHARRRHRLRRAFYRAHRWFDRHPLLRLTRKLVVGVVGSLLVIAGVISGPFVPGPQILVVILGLGLLASEFIWARWALRSGQARAHRISKRFSGRRLKSVYRWKKWARQRFGIPTADNAQQ